MTARYLDAGKEDWTGGLLSKKYPPDLHVAHVNLLRPYRFQNSLERQTAAAKLKRFFSQR